MTYARVGARVLCVDIDRAAAEETAAITAAELVVDGGLTAKVS